MMSDEMLEEYLTPNLDFYLLLSNPLQLSNFDGGDGDHFFGGTLDKFKNDTGVPLNINLLLDFDLRDPSLRFLEKICSTRLPLAYTMRHESSQLWYSIKEDEIIVHRFAGSELPNSRESNWPYPYYPNQFDKRKIGLLPISYEDHKSYVFSQIITNSFSNLATLSEKDRVLIKRNNYPFSQIGGIHCVPSGISHSECANPECNYKKVAEHYPEMPSDPSAGMHLFVTINGNSPIDGVSLWGEFGESAQIQFYICESCFSIHVFTQYLE